MTTRPWTGAVLAGGASRRMGRDKALLEIDGEPMVLRVAASMVDAGATDVVVIGGDATTIGNLGVRVVPDDHPGEGPLGGLLTALHHAATDLVVLAPCDLLAPDASASAAVVRILEQVPERDAVVPIVDGVWQPLNGAFRTSCRPALLAQWASGERSVKRALLALSTLALENLRPDGFRDADSPDDLPGTGSVSAHGNP